MRSPLETVTNITPRELPNKEIENKLKSNISHLPTTGGSDWTQILNTGIVSCIADTQRRPRKAIQRQYGTTIKCIVRVAVQQWHPGAQADDIDLARYYADKVTSGAGNPATWQLLQERYAQATDTSPAQISGAR